MLKENPKDRFSPIRPEDIPTEVVGQLIRRGGLHIDQQLQPQTVNDLDALRYLTHENGDRSYLADQTKIYYNGEKEAIIHVIDASPAGQVSGMGEVRFNRESEEDYFKEKPFVGWTSTEYSRHKEGLGSRRLLVMRLASAAQFGLALHSDTLISEGAVRIWERMVENGLAERYAQLSGTGKETLRFKFK